jgi:predicted nucleic acid-binding protein
VERGSQRVPRRASQAGRIDEDNSGSRAESEEEKGEGGFDHPDQGGQGQLNLILDSNILVKLVIGEEDSEDARLAIDGFSKKGYDFCTVDIALAEGLNALWKHCCLVKDLKTDEARVAADDFAKIFLGLNIVPTSDLHEAAMEIALTHNIAPYDSLYAAASKKLGGTLYTADQKLYTVACKIANSTLLRPQQ